MAVIVSLGTLWFLGDPSSGPAPKNGRDTSDDTTPVPAGEPPTADAQPAAKPQVRVSPTADEVVSDPDCRMVVGQRAVADTALVVLPLGDGAWFALVDGDGIEFEGTLPFVPERPVLGRRPDGTILAGFSFDGSLRIVHDGHVIYEFDNVWDFDIANNGSSFYVVEPLAGGASRLIVRNLDLRQEHHFDLGTTIARTDRGLSSSVSYSVEFAEVGVKPSLLRAGTNRFYPVTGGEPREVVVEHPDGMAPRVVSLFESSEVAYHAYIRFDAERTERGLPGQEWMVVKVQQSFDRGSQSRTVVWAHDLLAIGPLTLQQSEDGNLLLLAGPVSAFVLGAADGQQVFSYPSYRPIASMDGKRFVYPPRDRDNRLQLMTSRFVGNRLFFYKWTEGKPGEVVVEGVDIRLNGSRLDGLHMVHRDVEKMPDESDLDFAMRTLLDPRNPIPCTDHAILDRRLEVRDGRLTYQRDAE
ncbi:MAG: hypothetical protein F4X98_19735 [Gammaproteobacteria bacterium]|nr:hypothetical protein [Gammaproteobacteria bacterium]